MMTLGTQYFGEPLDMEGCTRVRVEARMLHQEAQLPALAIVRVQGTDDGKAEKKKWVEEGGAITLSHGTWLRRTIRDVRPQVRVLAEVPAPGGRGRIEIRLTRLP